MTITTRFIGYFSAAAVAFALVAPVAASAQTANSKAIAQAVALETRANQWLDTPAKWPSLARALEQAAHKRGADDPQALKDLMFAATVRMQLKEDVRAQSQYVQAAEWALATGDVQTAATAYVRAAVVAAELKDVASAQDLRDRAARLARSPLLTQDQRTAILSHFTEGI